MFAKQMIWLFFGLRGRISPAPYLLASLLIYVSLYYTMERLYRVLPVHITPEGPFAPEVNFWASVFLITLLFSFWCNFALCVKRFHDFGKPTAFGALSFIFGLTMALILPFFKGDKGPNQFGQETNSPV